jgi:hypothetical protein
MIIYGTHGSHFATQPLPGAVCTACQSAHTVQVSLVSRYVHVYWLPLFPYQKLAVLHCTHCGADWANNAWPAALAPAVRALKQQAPAPTWTWLGTFLVVLLASFGLVSSLRNTHADEALLERPHAGDIYTVRSDSAQMYSLLKVRQVSGNSVELVANDYQTPDDSPINSLNAPARYSHESFVLTRLDLQIMRRKGQLIDVDRLGE